MGFKRKTYIFEFVKLHNQKPWCTLAGKVTALSLLKLLAQLNVTLLNEHNC